LVFEASITLLILGFLVTGVSQIILLRVAHAWQLYAHPNERSAHVTPTPSIGGIGLVLPMLALLGYLAIIDYGNLAGLAFGGLLLAVVSLWDDVRELGAAVRLPVHLLASGLALTAVTSFDGTGSVIQIAGLALLVVAVGWHVNLYNFMDGTDGYAGSQCLLFALGVLWLMAGGVGWAGVLLSLLVGCSIGFLVYNWPPAKIFMGDVGSSFLGLLIGVLVVQLSVTGQQPLVGSLLLLAAFWFDASYTLCVRIFSGQQFAQAHNSHLYQRLAQRYGHRRVLILFWLHGLLWLLPLAWLSNRFPDNAAWCLLVGVLPLGMACWYWQAGQRTG